MRWAGHGGMHGRDEKCIQYFFGKPEGKSPVARPRRKRIILK
jgi:hypothetical protein